MNRNLRIFLSGGIPFGIITGIFFAYRYDLKTGLMSGLSAGLMSGFLIFLILGFLHGRAVNRIADTKSHEVLGTHHTREIELRMPYDTSFDLCIASLGLFRRCVIRQENRPHGKIVARTGINWKTWSDTVTFSLKEMTGGNTYIRISSRPSARSTLVDFGKNLDNVERITAFLNKHSDQSL